MDLNIVVATDKHRDHVDIISAKLSRAFQLGHRIVALNVCIGHELINDIPEPFDVKFEANDLVVLWRLTVKIEDTLHTHYLNKSDVAKKYDILSVIPTNEKIFCHLTSGHFDYDIMSLSLDEKLPKYFKKSNLSLLLSRGIAFEINYGNALLSQTARQLVISGGQVVVEKTNGKNILLSSGSQIAFATRSPEDVANLGLLFGLKNNQSKAATFKNGLIVLRHSELRRNINFTAIEIRKEMEPKEKWLFKELESS